MFMAQQQQQMETSGKKCVCVIPTIEVCPTPMSQPKAPFLWSITGSHDRAQAKSCREDRKVTKYDTIRNKRSLEHFAFIYLFIYRTTVLLLLAKESSPYRYVEVISVLGEE